MNMLVSDGAPGARGPWTAVVDTVRMPWSPDGALPDTVVRPALAVLYRMAIGPAADYYVPRLLRREANSRSEPGWVWPAFFFPVGWAFHRRRRAWARSSAMGWTTSRPTRSRSCGRH